MNAHMTGPVANQAETVPSMRSADAAWRGMPEQGAPAPWWFIPAVCAGLAALIVAATVLVLVLDAITATGRTAPPDTTGSNVPGPPPFAAYQHDATLGNGDSA